MSEELQKEIKIQENNEITEATIPAESLIKINIDELKPNSIIVVKINPEGMQQRMAATQQIAMALRPLAEKIKAKNIVLIVMANEETMEALDEEQMGQMGWFKKTPSLIINPNTGKPM